MCFSNSFRLVFQQEFGPHDLSELEMGTKMMKLHFHKGNCKAADQGIIKLMFMCKAGIKLGGRKGLCGHTGEQGPAAAADVKLISLGINRIAVLGSQ